jgi:type IV conjugative transfer system coupling protein TraD
MSNFLRGGQVTAHRFRMTLQVLQIIVRMMIIAIALTIFLTVKNNINSYEWKMVGPLLKKYAFTDINPEKIVSYSSRYGYIVQKEIKHLEDDAEFRSVERKFYRVYLLCLKRCIWVIACGLIFSILFFWFRGKSLQLNSQLRGSFLITEQELIKQAKSHNKQFKGIVPYTISEVPYVATGRSTSYTPGEQAHTLILGATGSGKTRVIQDLVRQLEGKKAIIVDIKGDYISRFYDEKRGDIILNPLDIRGSNWSFFKETDVLRGFDTIARSIIPDDGRDPFWANGARVIFSEMARLYQNAIISLSDFADKILKSDIEFLGKLLNNTSAKHLSDSTSDKTVVCILMMLSVYLTSFRLYNKAGNQFSITNWVLDPKRENFLFISTSLESKNLLNPLVRMQVDIAINALCSIQKNNKNQIWFILDELPYFDQGLPNLKDGLTISRSFGGAFVLGSQDMSSLNKIYGQKLSEVIANNCRNKLIMNVDDPYTCRWCSDLFGEGEVEEWHEGLSYGAHSMRDGVSSHKTKLLKKVILTAEFSQLKTGEGYLKLPELNPALIRLKDNIIMAKNPGFIEDPSLRQLASEELARNQTNRLELERISEETSNKESTNQKPKSDEEQVEKKELDRQENDINYI